MKILLISSSPRKERSLTFLLAKEVLRGAANNNDVEPEEVHLCDVKIDFCRHCEFCHKNILSCSIKDDVPMILKKMIQADGIILASPNYVNHVNALMKALFDRCSHFIHCKRLLDKYIVGVVSSGSGEDAGILDYIGYFAHVCGAQYSGGVSSRVPISKEKLQEAYLLGEQFALDIKEEIKYPEQLEIIDKSREHFKKLIQLRRDEWLDEREYWQDKGWL